MLIKNFIRLIILGLLLVITSPANHVKAQYDSDYGIDHGPLAPALSSEEIMEIEKLFEEAKTEEAFKELWIIFKSFILAYKIGDSPKLVEAYEKFMAVRKIAVNCGVRLKDTKTKLGSILNAPAKELADFVTFTRPGTKTSIGLEIELLGSYSSMKVEVVECHLSKDIPSGEAAKIKTVFNQEIKSKLSGKTYTDLEVARADIETYIISFLNALDKQLTFKGNADQETPDFDGEISLSAIPAFDEKKRNAEEVLTFQDFAGLPPEAARQISELVKNFESKKYHCRVVVTNEASKALPIGKDGISGTGSVFNDLTKQFNSDMAIAGGRDMALWLHYDESLKKIRYKVVLKGSQISPTFVFNSKVNPKEPNPTELDGIRKRAILSAIKNTNLHSKSTTITDKQLNWVEMAIWAGRVGKEALAKIQVPEPMWKYDVPEKYPVTVEPLSAGVGDGLIGELKAVPEFLTLVLSSFDEKQREEMVNAVKSIDAVQIIKDLYKEKAENYTGTPDIVLHTAGADMVVVGSLLVGGEILEGIKLVKKLKEIFASLPDLAKKKMKSFDSPKDFLKDLGKNKDLLDKIKLNPELTDSWKILKDAGVEDAVRLGKNGELEKVNKYLADSKKTVPEVSDEIIAAGGYKKWITEVSGMVGKYDWGLVRKYFSHIQEVTGRAVPQKQIEKLKDALRAKEYKLLSKSELDAHRADFNSKRDNIIANWERETGQIWPKYTEIIYDKNGDIYKRIGDKYDAHHIIENKFGGNNEWWNMHPAKSPSEHQGGIHGAGSPSRELFK